jgi:hypothetical protein
MSIAITTNAGSQDDRWQHVAEREFKRLEAEQAIEPSQFYTQDEIKRVLKISTRRITQAMKANQLKGRMLGRKRIVLGRHLIDWLSGDCPDTRRHK